MIILFEPWNLGDAIIAASVARLDPDRIVLACNSAWHEPLQLSAQGSLNLLPLDLPYVWRQNKSFFSLGSAAAVKGSFSRPELHRLQVISIRGDLRDWIAAHRLFSGAAFRFSGWQPFLARKVSLLDRPFSSGNRPVRNRYRAWAEAAGIPFSAVEAACRPKAAPGRGAPVVIHAGAQWRSKQFPHVAELAGFLEASGRTVKILAGPRDPLPPGVTEARVQRPSWAELAAELREAYCVVANDSGPMHLAAFLGCRVIALSRCSNIAEWLPPSATALSSPVAPRGYRPVRDYWSDRIMDEWPTPAQVIDTMENAFDAALV